MPGINGQFHLGTGAVIGTEEWYVPRDRSKRFWANILHVSAPDQGAGFIGSDDETFLAVGLTLFGLDRLQFMGHSYCHSWIWKDDMYVNAIAHLGLRDALPDIVFH